MDASLVYVRALALGCFHSHISTQTFRGALTSSVDSCAEVKSAPPVASPNLAEFGGRCRKAVLGVWKRASKGSANMFSQSQQRTGWMKTAPFTRGRASSTGHVKTLKAMYVVLF